MRSCAALLALLAVSATAGTDLTSDNSLDLELEGYIYLRYTFYGEEAAIPDDAFSLRRAGIKTDFELSSDLSGQLQVETRTDEIYLKDCFAEWRPLEMADLTLGLFKVPFGLNTLTGSWDLYSPEHTEGDAELTDLRYAERDLGAMLTFGPTDFSELMLCASNGEGPSLEAADRELQYTARAAAELPEGVILGLNATRLRVGQEDPESIEGYECSAPQTAWGADADWSRPLGSRMLVGLTAEYLEADNWMQAEVIDGEEPPLLQDLWGRARLTWYPRSAGRLKRIDLSLLYERIDTGDGKGHRQVIMPALTVWPADTWRVRLAGMTHLTEAEFDDDYTDITLEMGAVF